MTSTYRVCLSFSSYSANLHCFFSTDWACVTVFPPEGMCLQDESYKKFAQEAMKNMAGACPTSLSLTAHHFAQVHADTASQGPLSDMYHLMRQEYCGATRMVSRHDFKDGVRAMMVDKDKQPKWDPAELSQVDPAAVKSILDPLPKDLELAWKQQLI